MSAGGAIVAHGVGSRQDLPLPFGYAVAGAAVALVVSFLLLGLLWREPRLAGEYGRAPAAARAAPRCSTRARPASCSRCSVRSLTGLRADPPGARQGRREQPGAVRGLRAALGGPGAAVGAVRPGLAPAQPVAAPALSRSCRWLGSTLANGALRLAPVVRLLAGGGGAVRVHLAGAGGAGQRDAAGAAPRDHRLRQRAAVLRVRVRVAVVRPRRRLRGVVGALRQAQRARTARRRPRRGALAARRSRRAAAGAWAAAHGGGDARHDGVRRRLERPGVVHLRAELAACPRRS